jgi:2-methylcitrate dehydratase PrpD
MSLTADFAAHLQALAAEPLDLMARQAAVTLFVDGISVAALGSAQPGPALLAALALENAGRPEASLIGHGARCAAAEAARVNGASMHVLDYEPMWNPANHSLSPALSPLLALVEREAKAPGRRKSNSIGLRFLAALAAGIEAQARLRLASSQFNPAELFFHPPGTVGPIGSAVASGIFLGLDLNQMVHAIGIAASRAGGLQANAGSMTKAMHCGQAAASGLESALLAQRGFTADADALGDPRGYGAAFFGAGFAPQALTAPRTTWHIVEPGPAFKLYPSQYGTHFIITAAREAYARLSRDTEIEKVEIICPPMPYVDRPNPATGLAGKFSFQYVAAATLLDGTVAVDSFTDARRFSPDLVALLPRIVVTPDPAREGRFDRMTIDLVVRCADGAVVATRCDGPPGIWGRSCPPDRLRSKASDCLTAAFGSERATHILDAAFAVDRFGHDDFLGLMAALSGPGSQ